MVYGALVLRCDCGYDFEKGTLEESYDRKVVPKEIKSFLIFLIVINLFTAIRALANVNTNGGVVNLFVVVVWSGLVYWAYSQFVQKKNWGRILLVVSTFPIGLFLLFNKEVKLYMLQINKPDQ